MGQDPNTIRREIDHTRAEMNDTVEALGYKADVKGRARAKITSKRQSIKNRISGAAHQMTGSAQHVGSEISDHTPSGQDIRQGAHQAVGVAQENPIGLAVGATALGFIAGLMAPKTRIEEEKIGPVATQAREQAMQAGQQALEHGQQIAQEVAGTVQEKVQEGVQDVKETAKQSAQEHGQELKEETTGQQPGAPQQGMPTPQSERAGVT